MCNLKNIYVLRMLIAIFIACLTFFEVLADENYSLNKKFTIFLEKEFLKQNIKTRNHVDETKFYILDINNNIYEVNFFLINKNINQNFLVIPTLRVNRVSDMSSVSISRSLTFETGSNLLEIENISVMLVNDVIKKMKNNGLIFNISDQQYKDKSEKKLKISINYFNNCESNEIIKIMENQFPGFIHMELDKLITPSSTKIVYFTTSTKQKIKKWIELSMYDFNFIPEDFFVKVYKNKIDLVKSNKSKKMFLCD